MNRSRRNRWLLSRGQMSEQVLSGIFHFNATATMAKVSPDGFVFCTKHGSPFEDRNVANRVWYPLLSLLKLEKRKPLSDKAYRRHALACGR